MLEHAKKCDPKMEAMVINQKDVIVYYISVML